MFIFQSNFFSLPIKKNGKDKMKTIQFLILIAKKTLQSREILHLSQNRL